jgi:hypothetical protein
MVNEITIELPRSVLLLRTVSHNGEEILGGDEQAGDMKASNSRMPA